MLLSTAPFPRSTGGLLMLALLSPIHARAADPEPDTEVKSLEDVTIVGEASPGVGNAALEAGAGFQTKRAELGLLGERDLLDTPMAVWSISNPMLRNTQAKTLTEILKYMPSTQIQARGGMEVGRPMNRGFVGDVTANTRLDGFNITGTTSLPMESMERVDVINGLTGSLFGPAAPAGAFNLVHKRPTDTLMMNISGDLASDSLWEGHADISDRIGTNRWFGYRLNVLKERGDGNMGTEHLRRSLIDLATDIHLGERTVVEVDGSHYEYQYLGGPSQFSYSDTVKLPHALDGDKSGYGQSYAGGNLRTDTGSIRIRHEINDNWKVVGGFGRQIASRYLFGASNRLKDNDGNYTTSINSRQAASRFVTDSNQLRFNGELRTGPLQHQLTLGTTGYTRDTYGTRGASGNYTLGSASISNPVSYANPGIFKTHSRYHSGQVKYQAATLGDSITWGKWTASAMLTRNWIETSSWGTSGSRSDHSSDRGMSRTYSLSYKPLENVTTYIAYASSLEVGDTAPTGTANEGQTTSPYRSKQYEAGIKMRFGELDVGLTAFATRRPFAFTTADNVYKVIGEQNNKGLELNVQGKVSPGLGLYGGITWLDPLLTHTEDEATEDKRVVGVPKMQANLLVEYDVPRVQGLVLTTNLHYTSKRAANQLNDNWLDPYHTIDLGTRYSTRLFGRNVVWRTSVDNVFNKHYWASVFANTMDGSASAYGASLGQLRTFRTSISVDL